MNRQKNREMIIIAAMLFISVLVLGFMKLADGGTKVKVTIGGEIYGTYNLNKNQEIRIETESGVNVLTIKDGKAMVTYADCPDKICVNMSPLSKEVPGIIVCLPHEVVVELADN